VTLQETLFVLKEGIDVSGKPLKDSIEVRELGQAFDYLKTLAAKNDTIRETDIRSLHSLIIKSERDLSPGEYRKVGMIISGSEHRPPEPLDVPPRMEALVAGSMRTSINTPSFWPPLPTTSLPQSTHSRMAMGEFRASL